MTWDKYSVPQRHQTQNLSSYLHKAKLILNHDHTRINSCMYSYDEFLLSVVPWQCWDGSCGMKHGESSEPDGCGEAVERTFMIGGCEKSAHKSFANGVLGNFLAH